MQSHLTELHTCHSNSPFMYKYISMQVMTNLFYKKLYLQSHVIINLVLLVHYFFYILKELGFHKKIYKNMTLVRLI